jgi:hypothetical protein
MAAASTAKGGGAGQLQSSSTNQSSCNICNFAFCSVSAACNGIRACSSNMSGCTRNNQWPAARNKLYLELDAVTHIVHVDADRARMPSIGPRPACNKGTTSLQVHVCDLEQTSKSIMQNPLWMFELGSHPIPM